MKSLRQLFAPLCLLLCLAGCSGVQPHAEDKPAAVGAGAPLTQRPSAALLSDRESISPAVGTASERAPSSFVYHQDPLRLRREIADVCTRSQAANERHFLRSLVADLYFSGIDPATGTEALVLGECGSLSDILTEMVAQGGPESGDPIRDRAHLIAGSGSGTTRTIDQAVTAGLARYADKPVAESEPPPEDLPAHGMLYFPSVGEGVRLDTAVALNRLYQEGIVGYGLYTFVMLGGGSVKASDATPRTHELLRVIETYVATTNDDGGPSAEAHVFLVPINAERLDAPLTEQAAADLSQHMRRQLSDSLRLEGQTKLAARLEQGNGPFLITTLEPRLLFDDPTVPRLVADLSRIGPEHFYAIVDAYDRSLPADLSGRTESLASLYERLHRLLSKSLAVPGAKTTPQPVWVFSLGMPTRTPKS